MRTISTISTVILSLVVNMTMYSQNVAITDDDTYSADSSAMLDIFSVNKGFLIPRMTSEQRDAINLTGNSQSLMIFNTDELCFQTFISGEWNNIWCFTCHPAITSVPTSVTICEGENTSFLITATGSTLSFQWQENNGSGWVDITIAGTYPVYNDWTTSILKVSNVVSENDGYQYRCIVSGACTPAATSYAATLTVITAPEITVQPNNRTASAGDNTSFNITANGQGLSYQWQENGGSAWNTISDGGSNPEYTGTTTSSLTIANIPISYNLYKYRCIVNGTCSPTAISDSAILSVVIFTCGDPWYDDRDGKTYSTVQIGTQCWMAENMNVGGDIVSGEQTDNEIIEKNCNQCFNFGGLYTWGEMMQYNSSDDANPGSVQGICPAGWHIPTDYEWKTLELHIGMTQTEVDVSGNWRGYEGGKLKDTTEYWQSPNLGATNETGFSARGGGYWGGLYYNSGFWWTATEYDSSYAYYRQLNKDEYGIERSAVNKTLAFSVRCLKD